jgi:hypothetical protein
LVWTRQCDTLIGAVRLVPEADALVRRTMRVDPAWQCSCVDT